MAIEASMLAYADPWNSGKPLDYRTVFLGGLQALSTSMLERMGGLEKTQAESSWGFKPLDKNFDKKFAKGQGSLKDGLVNYSANWMKGCMMNCMVLDMTDTQMVFLERPRMNQLVLAFRGTNELNDIVCDLQYRKHSYPGGRGKVLTNIYRVSSRVRGGRGKIHRGIYRAWSCIQDTVLDVVKKRVAQGINKILVTGHSLGGGLATFCSLAIAEQVQGNYELKCYTFGSAVTGDKEFCEYCNNMVPKNFRIVLDTDPIPLVGSTHPDLGYWHPGNYVHVNDNGLWINPAKGDVVEDGTGWLRDHGTAAYLLAMHFYQASTATASVKDKLKEAWKKYLRQDEKFDQPCVVACLEGEKIVPRRIAKPDTAAMQEVLRGTFDDEALALIEPAMFWVMRKLVASNYSAKKAEWKHFVIAVAALNYSSWAPKKWCRYIVQLHAEFINFDMDGDNFLTEKEFEALCTQTDAPFSKNLKAAFATEENVNSMKETFKDIDANHDGVLSFDEYVIWRWMGEVAQTLKGPWFDDNPFEVEVNDFAPVEQEATDRLDVTVTDLSGVSPTAPTSLVAHSS